MGSAPRPPGALLAVRDDGVVSGSVSGGCVEDDLIACTKVGFKLALQRDPDQDQDKPTLIAYGVTQEGICSAPPAAPPPSQTEVQAQAGC